MRNFHTFTRRSVRHEDKQVKLLSTEWRACQSPNLGFMPPLPVHASRPAWRKPHPEATVAARRGLDQPNPQRQIAVPGSPGVDLGETSLFHVEHRLGSTAFKSHLTVPLVPTRNPTTGPSLHLQGPSQETLNHRPQGAAIYLVDRGNHKEPPQFRFGQPASPPNVKVETQSKRLAIKLH